MPLTALEEDKKKLNQQANVFIVENHDIRNNKGSISKRELITQKKSVSNLMTANNTFKVAATNKGGLSPKKNLHSDENIDAMISLVDQSIQQIELKNED